jgi:hypothetical protein
MACCVLAMAFIAQLFALRRKVRRALGLPVGDWYDEDEPQPGFVAVWGGKLRGLLRNGATRAALIALVLGEITFVAIAAPGPGGLIAEHRSHARAAWEYVQSFGAYIDVSALWCAPASKSASKPTEPALPR